MEEDEGSALIKVPVVRDSESLNVSSETNKSLVGFAEATPTAPRPRDL